MVFGARNALLLAGAVATFASLGVAAADRSTATGRREVTTVRAQGWLTTSDRRSFAAALRPGAISSGARAGAVAIAIDPSTRYQKVIGFGAALTASSAQLLTRLPAARRTAALEALLTPAGGAGINVLRVVIGASDFAATPYTYDDLPPGSTDSRLRHFSIAHDVATILPLLRQARRIDPHLVIVASPWSAPAWMKTNGSLDGGTLKRTDDAVYSRYLVRFLRAYAAAGVPIDAITAQNEPEHAAGDYPTMTLTANREATFIGDYLGPALARAGLSHVKLLGGDGNWLDSSFPIRLLHSPAGPYLGGTAFHCYAGTADGQAVVHAVAPRKAVWLTECSGGAWSSRFAANLAWDSGQLMIAGLRNWAQTIMFWNLMLSRGGMPHDGGCADCRGILTAGAHGTVRRNVEFAVLAQASSAARPGAVRIGSPASVSAIRTVAFVNPDGSRGLILDNQNTASRVVDVSDGSGTVINTHVPGRSTVSLRWSDHPAPHS